MVKEESIGSTIAASDGTFCLRTETGYASELIAGTADDRLGAIIPIHSQRKNIVLRLEPNFGEIDGDDPSSDAAKAAHAALLNIMRDISKHPEESPKSLREYTAHGVITQQQLYQFTSHPKLFFGSSPSIDYHWGNQAFRFRDATTPLVLQTVKGIHPIW